MNSYSIAKARHDLAAVVHEVETTGPVELTRRGKPVAVLLSRADYDRLHPSARVDLWEAICQFRAGHELDEDPLTRREVDSWRDRSPPRPVEL